MRRARVYGRDVEMQGSPYTLMAYRSEFDRDLFGDVLGAYEGDKPDLSVLMQVVWAMCRTRDEAVPPYAEWLRGFDPREFALGDARALEVIDSAVAAELFRAEKAGRWRRRVARRMDALAKRIGTRADRLLSR